MWTASRDFMSKIIQRQEARALGLKRYFTGKPCKRGHVTFREVARGNCVECNRLWRQDNAEKVSFLQRRYRENNVEKIREYQREYRKL